MSFLSCIGKKSKKKKSGKEPIDKRAADHDKTGIEETPVVALVKEALAEKNGSKAVTSSSLGAATEAASLPSNGISKTSTDSAKHSYDNLQSDIGNLASENEALKSEAERYEASMKQMIEEVHRLESANLALKTKVTITEAENSRVTTENQRLVQKIVGMEENQAMMSRAELQNLIKQLEDAEVKSSTKPASELSGIRTNPVEPLVSRKKLTQEDKHISWKLTRTEARLSQSEEENKQLRTDLKEMLDTHAELQQQIVSDTEDEIRDKVFDLRRSPYSSQRDSICSLSSSDIEPISPRSRSAASLREADDLIERLVRAEIEQNRLHQDYTALLESFKELQTRICETESENKTLRLKSDQLQDLQVLVKRLSDQEEEQNKRKNEISSLQCILVTLNTRVDQLSFENNIYKTKNDDLNIQTRNYKNQLEKLYNDIQQLKDTNKKLQDENKKLSQQLQKRKDTTSTNKTDDSILTELSDLKQKYEESNKRWYNQDQTTLILKEITTSSSKPSPQIKNLDLLPSSPAMLGERFRRELYDRKWKEALYTMTNRLKKDEKRAIQILGELCTEAYLFCKRSARMQIDTMTSSLLTPTANHYRTGTLSKRNGTSKSVYNQLPDDLRRRLFYYRATPTQESINAGVSDFLNQIDYDRTRYLRHISERELSEITAYITVCFEICWCMAVQDPPMYLLFKVKHGQDVEQSQFDLYQNKGKRVDYVVWPAVFTGEGGQCLQRGVIQTLPERT